MHKMERVLLSRLKRHIDGTNTELAHCNISELTIVLRDMFPDYRRLKENVLSRSIETALRTLKKKQEIESKIKAQNQLSNNTNGALTSLYARNIKASSSENEDNLSNSAEDQSKERNVSVPKRLPKFVSKPRLIVPVINFSHIGGLSFAVRRLCQFSLQFLHSSDVTNLPPACGLLITGPSGCGKTLIAEAFCGEFNLKMLKVSCPELISGLSGDSENKIREMFEFCKNNSPCVLFLDDIDSILQKRESSGKQMEFRIISQFVHCFDDLINSYKESKVLVIGTTTSGDIIDPMLRRAGRFDTEISLGMPNIDDRVEILKALSKDAPLEKELDLESVALFTPGFVGADLKALLREAALIGFYRTCKFDLISDNSRYGPEYSMLKNEMVTIDDKNENKNFQIQLGDFQQAVTKIQPSSKREGFITVPNVSWNDVGALHEVRKELKLAIIYPVKHRHLFDAFSLSAPPGILLTGPPGCGKTLMAKAVANEAGINFISVKGPELLNMYLGESERAVRQVFSRAKNSAPCVIFFDEIDALCPKRKDSDHGSRVVQQFLTELDGVESREGVYILAATNRPDVIDSALLRPGRFDKILPVPIPSASDRLDILRALTKNGTQPSFCSECKLEDIAQHKKCVNFSGADLAALVREASLIALQEILIELDSDDAMATESRLKEKSLASKCVVSKHHFEKAFLQVRSSVEKSDFAYAQFFNKKS